SREAGRALDHLQEDGELARWQMLASLEDFAHQQVRTVATSIFREVADLDESEVAPALLDDQQLEVVVTDVVYGRSGADSGILRSLQRCLDPATTRTVDPIRYLTTQVRRDLSDQVRVAIGDPQVGSRVRRIARALGTGASLAEIIDRYNQVHSSDRIPTTRALRAPTVAPIGYLPPQVRRDLSDQVRVAIGDPQVGSRVRRIARALGTGASLAEIIDRYNQVHSSDRISTTRAIRALTVAPSIESTALRHVFEARDV